MLCDAVAGGGAAGGVGCQGGATRGTESLGTGRLPALCVPRVRSTQAEQHMDAGTLQMERNSAQSG